MGGLYNDIDILILHCPHYPSPLLECTRSMTEAHENPDCQGYTSTIYKLPSSSFPPTICKSFNEDCVAEHFPTELEAYKRFEQAANGPPSSILKFHGLHSTIPHGLILSYAGNGAMWDYRWGEASSRTAKPSVELLYRWTFQAISALSCAHGLGVLNSDIH